jgi:glycosyltransferase involved in cell wall biosynthesis
MKIGGIGAVLEGLITSPTYGSAVDRTILIGPLFSTDGAAADRLGPDGEVLYSSLDGMVSHPVAGQLDAVRRDYNVDLVYGRRQFIEPGNGRVVDAEVLLIDVRRGDAQRVNAFKSGLWENFWIDSKAYEHSWEYDQYVRLAPPAIAALHALGACAHDGACIVLAHEFMGMPTALAAILDRSPSFRTVFYAHEVATMRKIVEDHRGHDTMFYNVLRASHDTGQFVEDLFGPQHHYFKHALVEASRYCDEIFAVGDYVVKELRFMGPDFAHLDIDIVYNGIPSFEISPDEALASKSKLQTYCDALLGYRPDWVFSHVARLVTSKGLWRDLQVLETVEQRFRETGETAVLFVLSTEVPGRRSEDIRHMETWWKWPVAHREGMPDLSGGEALYYAGVQAFNARARNVKVVFVNQWGWNRAACGERMPADMEMIDLRKGADLEFGQSIYEPYGIAQVEALVFGGLCVLTNVCGCAGMVDDITDGELSPNVIVADYTKVDGIAGDVDAALAIDVEQRDAIERRVSAEVGREIVKRLPTTPEAYADMLRRGWELGNQMSWDAVVRNYFLPGIERAARKSRAVEVS